MGRPVRNVLPKDMEPDSGFQDSYKGKSIDSYFGPPPDAYLLKSGVSDPWLFVVIDDKISGEKQTHGWSIGGKKNWQITREGKEVVSANDPELHTFNNRASAGILNLRIMDLLGDGDREKGKQIFLGNRKLYMTDAEAYIGLDCTWLIEVVKNKPDGGENRVLLPQKPLTLIDTEVVSGVATAAAPPPSTPVTNGSIPKMVAAIADGKTFDELKKAAYEKWGKGPEKNVEVVRFALNKANIKKLIEDGVLMGELEGPYMAVPA